MAVESGFEEMETNITRMVVVMAPCLEVFNGWLSNVEKSKKMSFLRGGLDIFSRETGFN